MSFKIPQKYRHKHPTLGWGGGNNGYFVIPLDSSVKAHCIVSDGEGWEHVSVHMRSTKEMFTPEWEEMCKIKDIFWSEEDCVIQYHPPKSEYVNNHPHVLHLWKPIGKEIPMPDSILVGVK